MSHLKHMFAVAYIIGFLWLLGWELAAFAISHLLTISDFTWRWARIPAWTWQRVVVLAGCILLTLHMGFKWLHLRSRCLPCC